MITVIPNNDYFACPLKVCPFVNSDFVLANKYQREESSGVSLIHIHLNDGSWSFANKSESSFIDLPLGKCPFMICSLY